MGINGGSAVGIEEALAEFIGFEVVIEGPDTPEEVIVGVADAAGAQIDKSAQSEIAHNDIGQAVVAVNHDLFPVRSGHEEKAFGGGGHIFSDDAAIHIAAGDIGAGLGCHFIHAIGEGAIGQGQLVNEPEGLTKDLCQAFRIGKVVFRDAVLAIQGFSQEVIPVISADVFKHPGRQVVGMQKTGHCHLMGKRAGGADLEVSADIAFDIDGLRCPGAATVEATCPVQVLPDGEWQSIGCEVYERLFHFRGSVRSRVWESMILTMERHGRKNCVMEKGQDITRIRRMERIKRLQRVEKADGLRVKNELDSSQFRNDVVGLCE